MFAEIINRRAQKLRARSCLKTVQVSAVTFTLIYLLLHLVLGIVDTVAQGPEGSEQSAIGLFASVLTGLIGVVLYAGLVLYCMAVRRGERAEYATVFDGFSMAGKIIVLSVIMFGFIALWSLLFLFPGVVAAYRYRFAMFNLLENPDLTPMQALDMSKRQTVGYKAQLFFFDMSYMGWYILGSLPSLVYSMKLAYEYGDRILAGDPTALVMATGGLWVSLFAALWSLVVQLFYLPQMVCAELGYFAAAKRTSGQGVDNGPSDFDPPTMRMPGPDDMNGNYGGGYKDEF